MCNHLIRKPRKRGKGETYSPTKCRRTNLWGLEVSTRLQGLQIWISPKIKFENSRAEMNILQLSNLAAAGTRVFHTNRNIFTFSVTVTNSLVPPNVNTICMREYLFSWLAKISAWMVKGVAPATVSLYFSCDAGFKNPKWQRIYELIRTFATQIFWSFESRYPFTIMPKELKSSLTELLKVGTYLGTCCGDVKRGQALSCVRMLQGQYTSWCTRSRLRHKNVL